MCSLHWYLLVSVCMSDIFGIWHQKMELWYGTIITGKPFFANWKCVIHFFLWKTFNNFKLLNYDCHCFYYFSFLVNWDVRRCDFTSLKVFIENKKIEIWNYLIVIRVTWSAHSQSLLSRFPFKICFQSFQEIGSEDGYT